MKLVVLATDCDSTWLIVNALKNEWPSLIVALETPVSRRMLLRNRAKKQGWVKVFGQLVFMCYLPMLKLCSRKRISNLITDASLSLKKNECIPTANFISVNSKECKEWLANLSPDVVVVNGTRILSAETLNSCSSVWLNTHCGITPAYRGVHGAYWALAEDDASNAGVTIHLVDRGIDTGDIVYQKIIEFDRKDNFVIYPIRQYIEAIPLLIEAIRDSGRQKLKTYRRNDLLSSVWYHPTFWKYLFIKMRRGVS